MSRFRTRASAVLSHPGAFTIRVLKGFRANQGYLLAGAVAYNTLLSILPLLILILIVLANYVEEAALLRTLDRYLDLVVPGQSNAIMGELALFLEHRHTHRLGARRHVAVLQFARIYRAGKCDVGDLLPPGEWSGAGTS